MRAPDHRFQVGIAYGARNQPIERFCDSFCAGGANPDVRKVPGSFLQENGFALMRFDQSDGTARARDGNDEARKARAGTDIDDRCDLRKVLGEKERFTVMALDSFFEALDAGQVQDFVPAGQELVMGFERGRLFGRERGAAGDEITERG